MHSIQLPVTIKNSDLTSIVYNFNLCTSKEQFNRTTLKSYIAKQINEYSTKNTSSVAASVFFNNGTIHLKHKVLQHIRKFCTNDFNGNMRLHYYFKTPNAVVVYGVSFINTLKETVCNYTNSPITTETITLNEICNSYTNKCMNGDFWVITFMKIYINTQSLFYIQTQQRITDFALAQSYKQKNSVILYLEDGTYLMPEVTSMQDLLLLCTTHL